MIHHRQCDTCGKPYHRVNKLRVWVARNPGHRDGWISRDVRLCNFCMDQQHARRILTVAAVRILPSTRRPNANAN